MDISVIIVNYNTLKLTTQSIESVKKYTKDVDYEIIVVDNASADGSLEKLKELFADVIFIDNTENVGFGRANNAGIQIAKGKYVFLLNSDAFLTSNALHEFRNFMDNHPDAAICGANLITGRVDSTVSYGNLPSLFESFSTIGFFVFYKKYFKKYLSSGIVNNLAGISEVGYINGADMFIRKVVLDEIGSFDKDFFMYFEETELSSRVKKAGYRSYILPHIDIIHLVSGSQKSDGFNYFKFTHYVRGKNLFFKKTKNRVYAIAVKALTLIETVVSHVFIVKKGSLGKKLQIIIKN